MITNKKNRYFHVTPKKNLQSILSNGLLPQTGEQSAEIREPESCIFLFPIFEEMDNALYNWLGEAFKDDEELVILQIDVPENFPIHQEKDSNGDDFYEAYCKRSIPGEYITAVYDVSYQLIKRDKRKDPAVKAVIVIHSYGENDFEVTDIEFPDPEYDKLSKEYEKADETQKTLVEERLRAKDAIKELAAEDLGEYGEVAKQINRELWNKNKTEQYYCLNVNLWYKDTTDYFGEVDTEVDYEYKLSSFEKEWKYLDLIQKEEKIYYIDYEDSKSSYTILGISEIHENEFQKTGLYYTVHADNLPNSTGYHTIFDEVIDCKDKYGRFFSTPELAHEAYCKMHGILMEDSEEDMELEI